MRTKEAIRRKQVQRALDELDRIKGAVEAAYNQVRGALVGLSESLPGADDFLQRLRACLEEIGQKGGLHVELQIGDASALQLPRLVQAQALLILREAMTNVCKHAQARNVRVCVGREDHRACFTVEDDGVGFDPHTVIDSEHLGLLLADAFLYPQENWPEDWLCLQPILAN